MRDQVAIPGGVPRRAAFGCDQQEVLPVLSVGQRRRVVLTRSRADMVQEQRPSGADSVADQATGESVPEDMRGADDLQDEGWRLGASAPVPFRVHPRTFCVFESELAVSGVRP